MVSCVGSCDVLLLAVQLEMLGCFSVVRPVLFCFIASLFDSVFIYRVFDFANIYFFVYYHSLVLVHSYIIHLVCSFVLLWSSFWWGVPVLIHYPFVVVLIRQGVSVRWFGWSFSALIGRCLCWAVLCTLILVEVDFIFTLYVYRYIYIIYCIIYDSLYLRLYIFIG